MILRLNDIVKWADDRGMKYSFVGNANDTIEGFSSLTKYKANSVTWIKKQANVELHPNELIKCAVIQKGVFCQVHNVFIAENSKEFFFGLLEHFFSDSNKEMSQHEGTYIGDNVQLDDNVKIGCNCVLDGKITIGNGTIIEHNVTIMNNVSIGQNCIIHSGTVIGKDGFGFAFDKDNIPVKAQHFGGVRIGDRVEIGANCTVDRGTIDDTVIGNDVKIDNLVLIAHNVRIDDSVFIIGCTDIAGSSHVGEKSYIGPQTCIKNQISVGKNSFVGMNIMLNESVDDNTMVIRNGKGIQRKCKDYRRFL